MARICCPLRNLLQVIGLCAMLLSHWQCARVVSPTGGPKDNDPPQVTRTNPANGATEFKVRSFRIYLNEYVTIKDPQKHIIVSPPLATPAMPVVQGRSVVLHVGDSLRENATYSVQFGKAIVDLTEGNTLPPYVYAFSTGKTLDTCWIEGEARDALLHTPKEGTLAALYRTNEDSAATRRIPDFVARSDMGGRFRLTNLPAGEFWLTCLVEKNGNMRYDEVEEEIGFAKRPVRSECFRQIHSRDSAAETRDSSISIAEGASEAEKELVYRVEVFRQKWQRQRFLRAIRNAPDQLLLIFRQRNDTPVGVSLLDAPSIRLLEESLGDSVRFWIMDSAMALRDSLRVVFTHTSSDSSNSIRLHRDTIRLASPNARKMKEERVHETPINGQNVEVKPLSVELNGNFSRFIPGDSLIITLASPPSRVDTLRIAARQGKDSTLRGFTLRSHAAQPRRFILVPEVKEKEGWWIEMLPGAFVDAFGRTNDTIRREIQMAEPTKHCVVRVALRNAPSGCLVQLISADTNKLLKYQAKSGSGNDTVTFRYVEPAPYGIRIVDDSNMNGQWDGGEYYTRRLPEPVRYFRDPQGETRIQVRANWEYDVPVDYKTLAE